MQKLRVFYVGMVCTSAYSKVIDEDVYVGAAAGKMSAVVVALRSIGIRAVLVSLPFVGKGGSRQRGCVCMDDGFPALFLPVWRSPVLRKILGALSLGWFAIRQVRSHDRVLFYNHALEYILALLILRLRGVDLFQDIEDVPTSIESGLRGLYNRVGYVLMSKLTSPRKVTVSNQVGRALNLRDYLAIQGVAVEAGRTVETKKWRQLAAGEPLRVHYGGSLTVDTGLALFCAAVARLVATGQPARRGIKFIVTGVGDLQAIRQLASKVQSNWLNIEVYESVERSLYFDLLDSCHASLSLKSPESAISCTTFPSKVIEITSRGLSLVSTQVSDVADIFTDDSAWRLTEFSDKALADVLFKMMQNPTEVRRRAQAGQDLTKTRFAPPVVGRALAEFLKIGPKFS